MEPFEDRTVSVHRRSTGMAGDHVSSKCQRCVFAVLDIEVHGRSNKLITRIIPSVYMVQKLH